MNGLSQIGFAWQLQPDVEMGFGGWIAVFCCLFVLAVFQASERRNIGRKGVSLTIKSSVGAIPTETIYW